eukprot:COSAG06_NODE_22411_length_724_cov_1.169600_1_plen_95_part_10
MEQVVDNPAIDADEQFFWELNGFIVLRVRAAAIPIPSPQAHTPDSTTQPTRGLIRSFSPYIPLFGPSRLSSSQQLPYRSTYSPDHYVSTACRGS